MATLQEVKQQNEQNKALLFSKLQESKQRQAELQAASSSLPEVSSQMALRDSNGLKGRDFRRDVLKAKSDIEANKRAVIEYNSSLDLYSKQIAADEAAVQGYEAELKDYQARKEAFENVQKAADKNMLWAVIGFSDNELERQYAKELAKDKQAAKAAFQNKVNELQKGLPQGERLVVDYKNLKINGIESGAFGQSVSIENYNQKIEALNREFGKTQMSKLSPSELFTKNLSEVKPLVVSPTSFNVVTAPSLKNKYQLAVNQGGYIGGTLDFLGNTAANQVRKYQAKTGDYYQAEGMRNLASEVVRNAPYFVPLLGEGLMIAEGVEKVIREPTATGKAFGVAEFALGGLSAVGRVKTLKATREAKLFEEAPTKFTGLRLEGEKGGLEGGLDFLFGYKQTSPNWIERNILGIKPSQTLIKIEQPFYFVGDKTIELTGGRGFSMTKTGDKLQASIFTLSGQGKEAKGFLKYGQGSKSWDVLKPTELEAGGGYINIREIGRSKGKLSKNYDLITGDLAPYYTGDFNKVNQNIRKKFIGGGRQEGNYIKVLSAEPKTARYFEGQTSVRGKINSYGTLYKYKMPSRTPPIAEEEGFFNGGYVKTKTIEKAIPKSVPSVAYVSPALEEAGRLSSGVKASALISKSPNVGLLGSTKQQTKTISIEIPKQNENVRQNSLQLFDTKTKESERTQLIQIQTPKVNEKEREGFFSGQAVIQVPKEEEGVRNKFLPRIAEALDIQQKQNQRQRQRQNQTQTNRFSKPTSLENPKTTIFNPNTSKPKGKVQKIIEGLGGFEAFGKRFGKDISLGVFNTKGEAEGRLDKFLRGTLGRSGFLSQGGKKIKSNLLNSPAFRPSKKDIFRVVQKSKFSLSSGSEKAEIFQARKNKKRPKSTFKWF